MAADIPEVTASYTVVHAWISRTLGTTITPPGRGHVVRITHEHRCTTRLYSAPMDSRNLRTYPYAVRSASVAMVPARCTFSLPRSSSAYWWDGDWYSPEKLRSMSGTLSP